MILSDIHVHTNYCDGASSIDEIIEKAVSMNMTSLGFSSHEYTHFDLSCCMTPEATKKYIADVKRAKDQYKDKIEIYLGTEKDYFGTEADFEFDYSIGSVHYLKIQDSYYPVDYTEEVMKKFVKEHFDGDYIKYVKMYFETVCKLSKEKEFDVLGHFNLVTKFNKGNKFFDENSKEYQSIAYEALEFTAKNCPVFEINTGAISRGYTDIPYPDSFMLKAIKDLGAKIILSSDSHIKDTLCFKFDDCINILKSLGYDSVVEFEKGKFIEKGI